MLCFLSFNIYFKQTVQKKNIFTWLHIHYYVRPKWTVQKFLYVHLCFHFNFYLFQNLKEQVKNNSSRIHPTLFSVVFNLWLQFLKISCIQQSKKYKVNANSKCLLFIRVFNYQLNFIFIPLKSANFQSNRPIGNYFANWKLW